MQKYTYIYILDTYRRNDKDAGRLLYKNIYLSLYCKGSKRVTQGLHVRGSWRPNITEIFWPQSYGRQRCVFLVLLWTPIQSGIPRAPSAGCGFPYHIFSNWHSNSTVFLLFNSSALYYLQTPTRWYGHASTPLQFLPISVDRDVSLPLSLEWRVWSSLSGNNGHAVQRSLSSGASVYESIMGFFFTSSHFISQFPPTRFPLTTAIGMCHFLPVHHLEWHFWPGQKVKT